METAKYNYVTRDPRISERVRRCVTAFSQGFSMAANPLTIPVAGIALLLFGNTALGFLPAAFKWYYLGIGAMGMMLMPGLSILLMKNMGLVSDLSISVRRERFFPMVVLLICYVAFFMVVRHVAIAFLLKKYVAGAIGCVILALGVTHFWKISTHMIAAGGLTALLTLLTMSGLGNMLTPLIIVIVLSGLLGSARLWLGHHTPAQVAAGYFGGFGVAIAVMLLF